MNKEKIEKNLFKNPRISPLASISPSAEIIGEVIIKENVIIAPHVSLRADEGSPFYIGKGTNIQDSVILHGLLDKYVEVEGELYSIYISSHVSIAHGALIHGPTYIDKKCFVGFRSIIHNAKIGRNTFIDFNAVIKGANIGKNCYIGINAVVKGVTVPEERYIADGQIINDQNQADTLPMLPEYLHQKHNEFNKEVVDFNKTLVELKIKN